MFVLVSMLVFTNGLPEGFGSPNQQKGDELTETIERQTDKVKKSMDELKNDDNINVGDMFEMQMMMSQLWE
jgi:hypothetical protein